MEGYAAALTDVENGDRVPAAQLPQKPSGAWWKLCGAMMLVALFGIAALLFLCRNLTQAHGTETNEHQQLLKQISTNVRAAIHLHEDRLQNLYAFSQNSPHAKCDTCPYCIHALNRRKYLPPSEIKGEFSPKVFNSSVLWRDGDGHSFFQGGLKLKNNEIIIPQNGLYFVYSQVSFRVRCSSTGGQTNQPLSHMIMRWSGSYSGQKPLLSAVRTMCQRDAEGHGRSKSWYNAVYLGAVFSLESEDRLWTETNQLKDVDGDDGKTFFGVFAL